MGLQVLAYTIFIIYSLLDTSYFFIRLFGRFSLADPFNHVAKLIN